MNAPRTRKDFIDEYGLFEGAAKYADYVRENGDDRVTVDGDNQPSVGGSPEPAGTPGPLGSAIDAIDEQRDYDRALLEQDRSQWQDLYDSGAAAVAGEGASANQSDDASMQWLNNEFSGLGSLEMPTYKGGYDSAAGTAAADPLSIMGQYEAAGKYRELTDPRITDAERAMMEISRRKQERDQRAARGAALSSLRGRGFASGGDEIAAMMGAQQETGQRRALEDVATRGQAVGRSMQALKGYADTTSDIRGKSFDESYKRGESLDATSEFNIKQRQDFDTFMADLQQKELQNKFDRSSSMFDKGRAVTGDKYLRGVADDAYRLDAFGNRPGGGGSGSSSTQSFVDLIKAKYGAEQAEKAAEAIKPDPGIFPDEWPVIGGI